MYVQDLLRADSIKLSHSLNEAHIYVCGDVNMAAQVQETLEGFLVDHNNMTDDEAKQFIIDKRVSI